MGKIRTEFQWLSIQNFFTCGMYLCFVICLTNHMQCLSDCMVHRSEWDDCIIFDSLQQVQPSKFDMARSRRLPFIGTSLTISVIMTHTPIIIQWMIILLNQGNNLSSQRIWNIHLKMVCLNGLWHGLSYSNDGQYNLWNSEQYRTAID